MAYTNDPTLAEDPVPPEMSERQRALRDLFVSEYLIDYHQVAAAMRCGFSRQLAVEWASRFMEEAYVQKKIKNMELTLADPEDEMEFNKQRIKQQLMREAHYRGPGSSHAARVSALAKLMSVYDMDSPQKSEVTHEHRGGVMRIPGAATSAEAWEAEAMANQVALQNVQGT